MFKKLSILFLSLLLVVCIVFVLGTEYIMRPCQKQYTIPDSYHLKKQIITNKRGEKLTLWLSPTNHSTSVLFLHGIRGNSANMIERAHYFRDSLKVNVILADQRAHGYSDGVFTSAGHLESNDIPLFMNLIKEEYNTSAGIVGISMGGAASLLAIDSITPTFLILESVYPNLDNAIEQRLRKRFALFTPFVKWGIYTMLKSRYKLEPATVSPLNSIKNYKGPILILGGSKDMQTTRSETEDLFENAGSEHKKLHIFDNAKHVDLFSYSPYTYKSIISEFMRNNGLLNNCTP